MIYLAIFFLTLYAIGIQPLTVMLQIACLPVPDKGKVILHMLSVFLKGLLVVIPALLAPLVVPIALLFTKKEDEALPEAFRWWDNDVSINGDVRQEGSWALAPVPLDDSAIPMCYWAKGHHPRSFWARYVWLGWRNRASRLSQMLGYTYKETDAWVTYGDPAAGRAHEGWYLRKVGEAYRFHYIKKLGKLCIRVHYGYKLAKDERKEANIVVIGATLVSWNGE